MFGVAGVRGVPAGTRGAWASSRTDAIARARAAFGGAFQSEIDERRLFLWVPVLAGAGVVIYFNADREPSLAFSLALFATLAAIAFVTRAKPAVFRVAVACCAVIAGVACGALRTARVSAPVLDRIRIVKMTGFVEEMDYRREGARFVLRVTSAEGLDAAKTPYRVRLTTKRAPGVDAGDFVKLSARLTPPARAALPGGYDFARDAFFARIGAVGNALGRIEPTTSTVSADMGLRLYAAVDRGRNALARRVERMIGGPAGAVGAAMVTGKRDLLDDPTREVIREAGIFHIITIAGVQMTLVAGIFFWGFRRMLAMSRTLALHYPIKKWAAGLAMAGAIAYDIATGSRVGTERALFMTLIMLGAVLFDRQAFSMRNLALAALAVIVFEPEAILGASFQLSFAAVAGLIAAWEVKLEARSALSNREEFPLREAKVDRGDWLLRMIDKTRHGPASTLFATLCATAATASFMAYNFHELSPYVLVGNPLTLAIIELFAVPGALIGAVLYPLGLDALVWQWLGLGINFVLWAASWIAAMPAATVHLHEFASYAVIFLSLAVLSAVLWRTPVMRATAAPLFAVGLVGAATGPIYDVIVSPSGDVVAARLDDGKLAVMGRKPSLFLVEQWLRADADGRPPKDAVAAISGTARAAEAGRVVPLDAAQSRPRCDEQGCVATLNDGRAVSIVLSASAFAEDCARADVIVAPMGAPTGCAAERVIDRPSLDRRGAVALRFNLDEVRERTARGADEDRPWSPAPRIIPTRSSRVEGEDFPDESPDEQAAPFR
jgi:competence protein ComEC